MAVRGAAGIADAENVGLNAKILAANPIKKSLFINASSEIVGVQR
jgi:hypothetical protein